MSTQSYSRRRGKGGMRFKPNSKGTRHQMSKRQEKEAVEARAAVASGEEKIVDERVFASDDKHGAEIERAEAQAAGIKPPEKPKGRGRRGRGRGGRSRPEESRDQSEPPKKKKYNPVPVADPPQKGLARKVRYAADKVINRVRNLVKPDRDPHKEVVINAESLETRVAVLEEGRLEEFTIERAGTERLVGSIFKGKVKNLEDGLKAAFVDIGYEKNAFLHYWDIVPSNLDSGVEVVEREGRRKEKPRFTQKDIPKKFPPGSEIIVQVTKGPIGTKGPRVTTHLAIPGRYLVLLPNSDQSGISRKIEDVKERQRLKTIVRSLNIPDGMGVIIRTVGEGQQKRYFIRDLALLLEEWRTISDLIQKQPPASCVFREPDMVERTVRDFLTDDVKRIVIDSPAEFERIGTLIGRISKRSVSKVKLYQEHSSIFDRFHISRQLENTFSRKVPLPSGGYIVIDETEALVSIDVNTGSHKGARDQESTIVEVNVEAADEICRQLRLRNMGGLIVLDFIDMKSRRDQQTVYQQMREGLRRDKAKTHILPISPLGLMEMTRQRHTESVRDKVYDDCHYCRGKGKVKSPITMSVEIQRKLSEILRRRQRDESDFQLRIVVNTRVLDRLRTEDEQLLIDMEKKYFGKLSFRADPDFHAEQFKIFNVANNEELASYNV